MIGNVWEWTQDWWTVRHSNQPATNPVGTVQQCTVERSFLNYWFLLTWLWSVCLEVNCCGKLVPIFRSAAVYSFQIGHVFLFLARTCTAKNWNYNRNTLTRLFNWTGPQQFKLDRFLSELLVVTFRIAGGMLRSKRFTISNRTSRFSLMASNARRIWNFSVLTRKLSLRSLV